MLDALPLESCGLKEGRIGQQTLMVRLFLFEEGARKIDLSPFPYLAYVVWYRRVSVFW